MKLDTTRFGEVEVDPTDVITFPDGLPGFVAKRFVLLPAERAPAVVWLQALETPELAFITLDPDDLDLAFEPRFKPGELSAVAPDGLEAVECRVLARTDDNGALRVNLFAPLLINRASGVGVQLPLVGSGYSTEEPWPPSGPSDTVDGP